MTVKNTIGKRYFDKKINHLVVALSASFVNQKMTERGFNDKAKILKELANRGYIQREQDRIVSRNNIGVVREQTYRFIIKNDDLFDVDYSKHSPRQVVNSTPAEELNVNFQDDEALEEIFNEKNKG